MPGTRCEPMAELAKEPKPAAAGQANFQAGLASGEGGSAGGERSGASQYPEVGSLRCRDARCYQEHHPGFGHESVPRNGV